MYDYIVKLSIILTGISDSFLHFGRHTKAMFHVESKNNSTKTSVAGHVQKCIYARLSKIVKYLYIFVYLPSIIHLFETFNVLKCPEIRFFFSLHFFKIVITDVQKFVLMHQFSPN